MEEKKKTGLNKKNVKDFFVDLVFIVIACIIGGFSSIAIMLPNGLTSGGITGIARILMKFCNINFSVLYYAEAVFVLILCLFVLGKREARNIVLLTIIYPGTMLIMEYIPNLVLLEEQDIALAAIYCGVFFRRYGYDSEDDQKEVFAAYRFEQNFDGARCSHYHRLRTCIRQEYCAVCADYDGDCH